MGIFSGLINRAKLVGFRSALNNFRTNPTKSTLSSALNKLKKVDPVFLRDYMEKKKFLGPMNLKGPRSNLFGLAGGAIGLAPALLSYKKYKEEEGNLSEEEKANRKRNILMTAVGGGLLGFGAGKYLGKSLQPKNLSSSSNS